MAPTDPRPAADRTDGEQDTFSEADLESAMKDVPKGTLALTGLAVTITIIAWLFLYFGVFIPRGVVN